MSYDLSYSASTTSEQIFWDRILALKAAGMENNDEAVVIAQQQEALDQFAKPSVVDAPIFPSDESSQASMIQHSVENSFTEKTASSLSAKQKAMNFFSTSKSKICGGFKKARENVSKFAKSASTKKFLKQASKVASIALLCLAGVSLIAVGSLTLTTTLMAATINPVCALLVPFGITAMGLSVVASRLFFQLAAIEIANFKR